ncbi:DUF6401 family natural product biosynthesis protein [Marinitenerispora sediminis]|uniref:Uncharacterized protein n=1 Tax=Marinitenerispora sediminis TaxID=1931232 RepID=A0A368T296_9ACTN|nr:DUF6401 family natural product biosynthesis protein [Marinitenerispora sediminis]RCV50533.1 hypothetical protein DEF28_17860 [Marinitenerispora sediminis]RCV55387.1 hypothetical protein DEF24_18025 [Marinitenerispora sediminis]RCV59381.1 hypothetical protein DEF23_07425 [Marinitenerispora sediminis]
MRRGFFVECPLARLSFDFGQFGLLAAREDPGVTAELDQHAAAVRDSIERDGTRLTRSSLTHYLHGFVDGCRERGWDSDGVDYDWETLRLLAICRLAKEYGFIR